MKTSQLEEENLMAVQKAQPLKAPDSVLAQMAGAKRVLSENLDKRFVVNVTHRTNRAAKQMARDLMACFLRELGLHPPRGVGSLWFFEGLGKLPHHFIPMMKLSDPELKIQRGATASEALGVLETRCPSSLEMHVYPLRRRPLIAIESDDGKSTITLHTDRNWVLSVSWAKKDTSGDISDELETPHTYVSLLPSPFGSDTTLHALVTEAGLKTFFNL